MWEDIQSAQQRNAGAAWLLTFTDLIGLLLCFFVLIFSTKTLDVRAWDTFRGTMRGTFSKAEAIELQRPDQLNNADELAKASQSVLPYLEKVFARRVADDVVWASVKGSYDKKTDQLVYELPRVLWDKDRLSVVGAAALDRIAAQMRNWRNTMVLQVKINGDTDVVSAIARAEGVRARLVEQGVKELRRIEILPSGGKEPLFFLMIHGEKSLCLGC